MEAGSPEGPGPWTSILPEDDARLGQIVTAIADALSENEFVRLCGGSLAGGSAGVATFFSYLSEAQPNAGWTDVARTWLAYCADDALLSGQEPAFFGGLAGIAWTMDHLARGITSSDSICRKVDERLLEHVTGRPWALDYDLVGGLVGYGVYALERLRHPAGRELLMRVIDTLASVAVHTNEGVTWWTAPDLLPEWQRKEAPEGYFNLGLAHGVPGVIALLGQACAMNVATATSRPLLDGAVGWLLAQRNPDTAASCFGTTVPKGSRSPELESRVAWCYGDLGVSAALYSAGLDVNEPAWRHVALDIARRAAGRPANRTGVRDGGLCHGASGNGHILNRFYQATREPVFLDAARSWFERTLDFHRPGTGIGGFQAWWGEAKPGESQWRHVPGLIEGTAGIGLALLASIRAVEPKWDRALLVAIPPTRPDDASGRR